MFIKKKRKIDKIPRNHVFVSRSTFSPLFILQVSSAVVEEDVGVLS